MTFLSSGFLFGLAGASIPLIIHLLARRSKRPVDFSSLLFLQKIERSSITWYMIREKYLLIIRTAFLIIVPIALSRPLCSGFETRIKHILVIDRSASMDGASGIIWNETIDRARDFIQTNRGMIHSIWTGGANATMVADRRALQEGDDFLNALSPTGEVFRFTAVVSDIKALVQAYESERIRIHLISDFQSGNWSNEETNTSGVEIYGLPIAGVRSNIGIGSANVAGLSSPTHGSLIAQIELANYGIDDVESSLGIRWAGETYGFPVVIPPGGAYLEFPLGPPAEGLMQGYVSLRDSSGFTMDNRFDLFFSTPARPTIAVIGGSDEERHRIQSVLIPSVEYTSDFRVKYLTDDQITAGDLAGVSTAIIFPIPISAESYNAVVQHRARGMGIMFICSTPDLPDSWCNMIEEITGESPGSGAVSGTAREVNSPVGNSYTHPILSAYRGIGEVSLPHVWLVHTWPLSLGRILLNLPDMAPLLVEGERGGGGHVLVWMTGFLPPMSDWSSRSSFVPLFRRSVLYASSDLSISTLKVGATRDIDVTCTASRCAFSIEYPDGSRMPLDVQYTQYGTAYLHVMLGYNPGAHVIRRKNDVVAVCHAVIDSVECIPGDSGFRPAPVHFDTDDDEYRVAAVTPNGPSTILLSLAGLCMLAEVCITALLAARHSSDKETASSQAM